MQEQIRLDEKSFLDLVRNKKNLYFIFDYDGTLTPLRKNHNEAILTDDEISVLNQLARTPNTKVAIVTGRSLSNIRGLLAGRLDGDVAMYGSHGGEKNEECRESNYTQHLEKIYESFKSEPHIYWEKKPLSITIHYKDHPDRAELKSRLDQEAERHIELFRVQTGHDVYEFLPKDVNKGLAIEDLHEKNPEYYLIFFGDDLTDNFGFRAINRLGGLSIQVSDRMKEHEAGYLINSVADSYALMRSYLSSKTTI